VIVVLMGVSGAGKTAVGELLAQRLGWPFVDGDDLHPASNVRKMTAGVPLTDEDRLPWLQSVRDVIVEHAGSGRSAVIACSALKRAYRELLLMGQPDTRLVYLRGAPAVFERRLGERRGHFFDPHLLASQLEAMEEPEEALVVDVDDELEAVVDAVVTALGLPMS
jgi:gluconokinase